MGIVSRFLPGNAKNWAFRADLEDRWSTLHRHCADQSSHLRLGPSRPPDHPYDYGVRESALAELELATQLIRIGAKVTFLA